MVGVWVIGLGTYSWLGLARPTGDGWGRGWNLIGFWIYSAPVVFLTGIVGLIRSNNKEGKNRLIALLISVGCVLYPLISFLVIREKG
jgi:hypothetical protein